MHTIRFSFWTWLRRVALAAALGVMPSQAGTYTVNTTADSGAGSLRQAITDANADPGAATINFQAGLGTITLASELPILKNPAGITINGNGNTVDGGSTSATTGFRVFFPGVEPDLTIENSAFTCASCRA